MKFGCCEVCVHREDQTACTDCDDADGFEFDESLIEIGEDGRAGITESAYRKLAYA